MWTTSFTHPHLALYIPLLKRDGDSFPSDDAHGRLCTVSGPQRAQTSGIKGRLFDGIDDKITVDTDPIGTNACTIVATIRPTGWGGASNGLIISNGKLFFAVTSTGALKFYSNGSTNQNSGANSIALNVTYRVVAARDAAGLVNFFANGNKIGGNNLNTGAPTAGSEALVIGNRVAADRAFDGIIRDVAVFVNEIWRQQRVTNDWQLYKKGER